MIERFWNRERSDAHEAFQTWRDKNRNGFFINCESTKMLHRALCPHSSSSNAEDFMDWDKDNSGDFGTHLKICSTDLNEMIESDEAAGFVDCADCHPT